MTVILPLYQRKALSKSEDALGYGHAENEKHPKRLQDPGGLMILHAEGVRLRNSALAPVPPFFVP